MDHDRRTHDSSEEPSRGWRLNRRRWPLLGFLSGWAIAVFDIFLFKSSDLRMSLGGQDVTVFVTLGFGLNFALLGYAVGRLALARSQARDDHRTITRQHDALLRSQEALVQQEKLAALGRLVASIAHELRNPLGVIRSAAGLLGERAGKDRELGRAAELVTEEVDHMNATITALLSFARPARLKLEELRVDEVLERARQLAEPCLTSTSVELSQSRPRELPPVLGDFNLLSQVVAGLLNNATESGSDKVELRAVRADGNVAIEVADDGPGISDEEARRIFEPFFTTKAEGTGLGLALAHRIADAHRGRLEVVERAGAGLNRRGACLRLSLPVAEGASP